MALMRGIENLSSNMKAVSVLQLRSYDFWRLGRLFTVFTPNTNYELKKNIVTE
jgi:hypothetical protein